MRLIRSAIESEVVDTYIRAELVSERFGPRLRELAKLHSDPRELLGAHRGWGRNEGMFAGFPVTLDWSLVALEPEEVLSILYIAWDWWLTVSGGTRRATDAAVRMRAGNPDDVAWHEPIARRLRSSDPPPELILVTDPARSRLVIVEGHVRLTAYALFPQYLPSELEAFLGESTEIVHWGSF